MPETGQYDNSQVEKLEDLANKVKFWETLGFQQVAIVKPNLEQASKYLNDWLEKFIKDLWMDGRAWRQTLLR